MILLLKFLILRTNQIIIFSYQFLRLWILSYYHNNLDIPIINENTIKMVFKTFLKASRGPIPKGENSRLLSEFSLLFNNHFKHLFNGEFISGKNLSQILNYSSTDMLKNIENNIKMNFFSYVRKFVNASFKCNFDEKIKIKNSLFEYYNIQKLEHIQFIKNCNNSKERKILKSDFL